MPPAALTPCCSCLRCRLGFRKTSSDVDRSALAVLRFWTHEMGLHEAKEHPELVNIYASGAHPSRHPLSPTSASPMTLLLSHQQKQPLYFLCCNSALMMSCVESSGEAERSPPLSIPPSSCLFPTGTSMLVEAILRVSTHEMRQMHFEGTDRCSGGTPPALRMLVMMMVMMMVMIMMIMVKMPMMMTMPALMTGKAYLRLLVLTAALARAVSLSPLPDAPALHIRPLP